MRLRRIAYVVNVFPKLSETFIAGELAELRRRGVEVRILSLRRPTETLCHAIVTEARLMERVVYKPANFAVLLREFRPQVLHAHFATEPTACARGLAVKLGVPFTFTAHGYDIHRRPPADFAQRAAAAAALVTVSRANARYVVKNFGLRRSRLRVIPCGVDTERFRPQARSPGDAAWREEPPLLVCVARLVPVKNLGLLLEACAELLARAVRFRCVIVGDGKSRDELEATQARLGLEDAVELIGPAEQSAVLDWWQRASVAVLTSEQEGMPVSLMEAAACGVPAVATAVGGIPELVEDGVTGLLAPPGDRPALVAALERLLQDAELAARMGKAARQRALKRFSVRRQVGRLLELWTRLIRREVRLCRSR
jgi:colanic acid/amylovoran biosynthesis glycosyltransferase